MGQSTRKVLGGALVGVCLALLVAGCNGSGGTGGASGGGGPGDGGIIQGDSGLPPTVTTVTNPNPNPTVPSGNIQGIVRDAVTGFPIVGAQVTLAIPGSGDNTVTTGASGQYSFANVPASGWFDGNGDGSVQFGELTAYTLTLTLAGVNAGLPAGTLMYPGAAFAEVVVGFATFADGNNFGAGAGVTTEAGSGNSTPVSGLTTSLNFVIGRLTEAIRGRVIDALNGSPIAGARVQLLDGTVPADQFVGGPPFQTPAPSPAPGTPVGGGIRLSLNDTTSSVTTDSDGFFLFTNVPAAHLFNVEVSAPGYVPSGTLSAFGGTCPVGTIGGGLIIDVPATPACVGPPLIGAAGGPACPNITGTPAVCGAVAAGGGLSGAGAGEILLSPAIPGVDATQPYLVSSTPADGADVDVTVPENLRLPIVLCFSERMQMDNAFTGARLLTVDFKGQPVPAAGPGGVPGPGGVTGGDATVSALTEWSEPVADGACPVGGGSVLTITPQADLRPGLTYGVFLGGAGEAPPADLAGNPCCRDFPLNALGSATSASVAGGGIGKVFGETVASPNLLLFTTNGGADVLPGPSDAQSVLASADFTGSSATVMWGAVDGAQGYEVYMSIDDGDFQLIAKTAPGNNPVRTLRNTAWSFNDALNGGPGVNPSPIPPTPPAPGRTPQAGYDGVRRNVVESAITDDGDDVTPLTALGVVVDNIDNLADLSDGFTSVRIAIATVNSNGIVGSLGTPVTIVDNTGPTTNITPMEADRGVVPLAGSLLLDTGTGLLRPGPRSGRGQVLQDLFDTLDVNSNGISREMNIDGVPDTIVIGFSEPVEEISAETLANYQLVAADGSTPLRLTAITIVSATLEEGVSSNGLFTPADDFDGDGARTRGNNVDGILEGNSRKGNDFGHSFVTLRIAPATPGGLVDIRDGDFVNITSVRDLSVGADGTGNPNRVIDPTQQQNQLGDITRPRITGATFVNNAAGTPDVITITFSEPLAAIRALGGLPQLLMSGAVCTLTPGTGADTFSPGDDSAVFEVGGVAVCDRTNLRANDSIDWLTQGLGNVTDLADNELDANFSVLTADAAGVFTVGDELPPPDTTAPRLIGVTVTNNSTGVNDRIVLTFDEALSDGTSPGTFDPTQITLRVGGVTCSVGTPAVVIDPALALGDITITLVIDVTAAPACDLNNLVAGDLIALGLPTSAGPAVSDIPGNGLDPASDHAVRNDDNTAYAIQGQP